MEIHLPSEAAALIRKTLSWDAEYARAILMKGYEVLAVVDLGKGVDRHEVRISPLDVFVPALRMGANALILSHSHPASPYPIASDEDIRLTERYIRIGRELRIDIIDHIILTERHMLSFKQNGLLAVLKA